MSNPFTFEALPYEIDPPASDREHERLPGSTEDSEQFLGDLWETLTGPRIVDRTAFTPRDKRKATRAPGKFYALVLHQMAFSRGSDPTRYDNVTAHYAILPDGTILQLHPDAALLWASNGFNAGSVAVEFAGNFPNTRGQCWEAKKYGCHRVTPEQIEAGRQLVRHLIRKIGLTHILAHRQSSGTRENDPGPDLWYHVGQWAVDELGLKDGGPGFKVGSGNPIPDAWRTWGRTAPTPGGTRELDGSGEFTDGETPEFEDGAGQLGWLSGSILRKLREARERVALASAIKAGNRDERTLTNDLFFARHPDRNGRRLDAQEPDFAALSREWVEIRDQLVRPALGTKPGPAPGPTAANAWVRELTPLLEKHRGDIPLAFLLGWISVESGGRIGEVTHMNERGYFQLHPGESKALKLDHARLSTDREYSILGGIQLVRMRARQAEALGFQRGTDLHWHVTKWMHWVPGAVTLILQRMRREGTPPDSWTAIGDYVRSHRTELIQEFRTKLKGSWDPLAGIANVDKLFRRAPALLASANPATGGSGADREWELLAEEEAEEAESSTPSLPESVIGALRAGLESVGVQLAVAFGYRDESQLTNLIFFTRHPERAGRPLAAGESGYQVLAAEWLDIRNRLVRPALGGSPAAPPTSPASPTAPSGPTTPATPASGSCAFGFTPRAVERPGGGRVTDKSAPAAADIVTVEGVSQSVPLHRHAAEAWRALVTAARAAGFAHPLFLPTSGYRDPARQRQLWEDALRKYGSAAEARKWVAPPGSSPHQSGRAIDLYLGGKNNSENAANLRRLPAYQWLARNAVCFGFYPYTAEPWHWEYNPPA